MYTFVLINALISLINLYSEVVKHFPFYKLIELKEIIRSKI